MTAIDASVSELSSALAVSSHRRPLSSTSSSSSSASAPEFALFTADPASSSGTSAASAPYDALLDSTGSSATLQSLLGGPPAGQHHQAASAGNWLADLSVEVCKVDDGAEEEEEEPDESSPGSEEADWDESVFLEAVAAAGQASNSTSGHHLDLLLGSPNSVQHQSSSSVVSGRISSTSSAEEQHKAGQPGSPSGSARCQQQPLPPQPCSMCSKVFTSTSALAKHKLTHSDERRFSCQLCGKAFKRQDHLNGHLITHREKKPFECRADGCGKSYCDARSLRRHQDNHHAGTGTSSSPAASAQHQQPSSRSASSSSSSSSSAGLFISELSAGGSVDLVLGPGYPAPSSNSSSSSWAAGTDSSCVQQQQQAQQVFAPDQHQHPGIDPAVQQKNGKTGKAAISNKTVKTANLNNKKAASRTKTGNKKSNPSGDASGHPHHHHQNGSLTPSNNDGLTSQQLELIQEIMRQTQEQHRLIQEEQHKAVPSAATTPPDRSSSNGSKPSTKKPPKVKWNPPAVPAESNKAAQPTPSSSSAAPEASAATAGRPVECNVCQRRFKNTPALNGHMRLHGGFLKKDAECSNGNGSGGSSGGSGGSNPGQHNGSNGKKPGESNSKRDPNTPPLLTASVSIRALIEEKIIQRRNNLAASKQVNPSAPLPPPPAPAAEPPISKAPLPAEPMEEVEPAHHHQHQIHQEIHADASSMANKLEPEAYFEGSLLALSPVSLHRALEGDMEENPAGSVEGGHHDHSAASALGDVPLLDDSVFHQVSAAAASALLSDISSLDLQSYMDSSGPDGQDAQHHEGTDCLSQYLAGASGDPTDGTNGGGVYEADFHHAGQHHGGYYESNSHSTSGFGFDPSTPLSSLCSPQQAQYVPQPYTTYTNGNQLSDQVVVAGNGFQQMMSSPYTPSPSPVSPAVPQQHRFQQAQHHQNGFGVYSTAPPPAYPSGSSTSFMIDCANSVLYNMEGGSGSGWDHVADLNVSSVGVTSEVLTMEPNGPSVQQMDELAALTGLDKAAATPQQPAKGTMKKPRPSRAAKNKTDEPEVKKARKKSGSSNGRGTDELDEMMGKPGTTGQFTSSMRSSTTLLLDPKRHGTGLYWNLVRSECIPPPVPSSSGPGGRGSSNKQSRVRVGKDHQCAALPRCKKKDGNKEKDPAVLCWNGSNTPSSGSCWEQQVGRLLAWSQSPALPGPRRTEEEVLAILTHFRNDVQAAKLHLFTTQDGSNAGADSWTQDEMAVFQAALLQHGKNFPQVAQHLPLKTAGQCVQFYYLWKKLCRPQDYAAVKMRQRPEPSLQDEASLSDWPDMSSGSVAELMALSSHQQQTTTATDCSSSTTSSSTTTTSSLLLLPSCEFADCPGISNNRAGNDMLDKLYPCSVCHKVFDKVKSRSAHMKTHKASGGTSTASPASTNKQNKTSSSSKGARHLPAPSPSSSSSLSSSTSLSSPFVVAASQPQHQQSLF